MLTGRGLFVTEGNPVAERFIRGDTNSDGVVDLADPVTILTVLFLNEGEIACEDAGDALATSSITSS
jgi:hypothetical protein